MGQCLITVEWVRLPDRSYSPYEKRPLPMLLYAEDGKVWMNPVEYLISLPILDLTRESWAEVNGVVRRMVADLVLKAGFYGRAYGACVDRLKRCTVPPACELAFGLGYAMEGTVLRPPRRSFPCDWAGDDTPLELDDPLPAAVDAREFHPGLDERALRAAAAAFEVHSA